MSLLSIIKCNLLINKRFAIYKQIDYNYIVTSDDLIKWRHNHEYSQSQLARALGVTTITISRWERGEREIPPYLHLALKSIKKKGGGIRVGRPVVKGKKKTKKKEVKK